VRLTILLDLDGVLFNSVHEVYQVCERAAKKNTNLQCGIDFSEFAKFRRYVTDAWQFGRLYDKTRRITNYDAVMGLSPDKEDLAYADAFFQERQILMENPEWPRLMVPYEIFYKLTPLINRNPSLFKIVSTRNEESIRRSLNYYGVQNIEIRGQESIRRFSSKMMAVESCGWMDKKAYVLYIDDMKAHLDPFRPCVDLCVHAGWGYDAAGTGSYTQKQVFDLVNGLVTLWRGEKE
jgi:hypothetical protein